MAARRPLWSPQARADLLDIWNYYARAAGPHTADNIVRKISEACRLLEDHPLGGRARDEIRPNLRSITAQPYVIFYRLGEARTVEIVRVIDGRRDLDEVFSDGDQ